MCHMQIDSISGEKNGIAVILKFGWYYYVIASYRTNTPTKWELDIFFRFNKCVECYLWGRNEAFPLSRGIKKIVNFHFIQKKKRKKECNLIFGLKSLDHPRRFIEAKKCVLCPVSKINLSHLELKTDFVLLIIMVNVTSNVNSNPGVQEKYLWSTLMGKKHGTTINDKKIPF